MNDQVILVDRNDVQIGTMSKLDVHQKGWLHRAFSIFIFNSEGEMLLQQRALDKYHSAGLWSNTCCSHPSPGEVMDVAAQRRLAEEMGISCKIVPAFSFTYKANFKNGLIEHEFDHVYIGVSDEVPILNRAEVNDWKYIQVSVLVDDIKKNPSQYSEWLKECLEKVIDHKDLLK